jgi:hypothetical protein
MHDHQDNGRSSGRFSSNAAFGLDESSTARSLMQTGSSILGLRDHGQHLILAYRMADVQHPAGQIVKDLASSPATTSRHLGDGPLCIAPALC